MSLIEAALAAIEALEPGEEIYYTKLHKSVELIALRSAKGTAVKLPHEQLGQQNVKISTPNKSRSSYAILSALQGKAYLLHGL
jgi:hypothetical protein